MPPPLFRPHVGTAGPTMSSALLMSCLRLVLSSFGSTIREQHGCRISFFDAIQFWQGGADNRVLRAPRKACSLCVCNLPFKRDRCIYARPSERAIQCYGLVAGRLDLRVLIMPLSASGNAFWGGTVRTTFSGFEPDQPTCMYIKDASSSGQLRLRF